MESIYVSKEPIGNLFSERQCLIIANGKANYFKKILRPFAKYISENNDTSNYRDLDSDLTKYLFDYYFDNKGDSESQHDLFWKNASSLPRILPIIYFMKINNRTQIRLTEIARKNFNGEISCKEFLLLWILRFQGSEFSNSGVLTSSDLSIADACNNAHYKKLILKRKVKPGLLALEILDKLNDKGIKSISDKHYRNARRLIRQDKNEAIEELSNIIIEVESDDKTQENQIFTVLKYLGLCEIITYETNNSKYKITGLGHELVKELNKSAFVYHNSSSPTKDYITYFGGIANTLEERIIRCYKNNGGDFND